MVLLAGLGERVGPADLGNWREAAKHAQERRVGLWWGRVYAGGGSHPLESFSLKYSGITMCYSGIDPGFASKAAISLPEVPA